MNANDISNLAYIQAKCINEFQKYTTENPLYLSSPKYKETLIASAIRGVDCLVDDSIIPLPMLDLLDKELMNELRDPEVKHIKSKMKTARMKLIKFASCNALEIFLCMNATKRSVSLCNYKFSGDQNKEEIKKTIELVRNKPQPPQRTPAWYEFRNNLITASNAWKALKSKSSRSQLITEKCKEMDISKYETANVNTNTAFHHGTKYEEISVMFYEHKFKTKVEDFGCIRHDKYHCLGASPDGINTCIDSPLYGRMLEIKNPVSREITGIPKEDYWIQMQLQMEVCNLDICDFLETLIKEYEDEDAFLLDSYPPSDSTTKNGEILTPFTHTSKGQLKGIIMYFSSSSGPIYEYMPLYSSEYEYEKWSNEMFEKHQNITWLKNIYWYMKEYSCVVVDRNRKWFESAIPLIEDTWKQIEHTRLKGSAEKPKEKLPARPKTRSRSNSTIEDIPLLLTPPVTGCLLNIGDGDSVSVVVGEEERIEDPIQQCCKEEKESSIIQNELKENSCMAEEDKLSNIYDVILSLLSNCEDIIDKKNDDNENKKKKTRKSENSICVDDYGEMTPSSSPMTRSALAKKKRERKEKSKERDENVIYVIT